jgi:hypothetical protein
LVLDDEPLHAAQLSRREIKVTRQRHRVQPERRRVIVTVYMDVRRLAQVVTHEIEPMGTDPKSGGKRLGGVHTILFFAVSSTNANAWNVTIDCYCSLGRRISLLRGRSVKLGERRTRP